MKNHKPTPYQKALELWRKNKTSVGVMKKLCNEYEDMDYDLAKLITSEARIEFKTVK